MIEISQAAAKEITRIKTVKQRPDSSLRLRVKEGGCSGLIYCLELESLTSEQSSQDNSKPDRQEYFFENNGIAIAVDSESYHYLQGTKLDYAEDLMGGGFRFQNPNATNVCGCGISFTRELERKHLTE